ncbi:MAG: hypothetical protein DRJ42_11315 [Deltaproteobacteria bacterium]|nr:MAG: hypothetical protein DRJ42_11315 [Deltaproteobacteria bacterium]
MRSGLSQALPFLLPLLLLGACQPPKVDLDDDEAAAESLIRDGVVAVSPRRPDAGAIEHTLRFPEPHTHYVEVESIFPTDGEDEVTLFMAVWTPGSYLVREFAGHVEHLRAATLAGEPLGATKSQKNRWTVSTGGEDQVVVRYRVYANLMSVQSSFVDDDLVVLNGAGIFLCPVGRLGLEHDVSIELGETHPAIATSLPPHPDGGRRFVASSYDVLVDSPIVAGEGEVRNFDVGGASFELWTFGGGAFWDHDRAAEDVRTLVEVEAGFWGTIPFERYLFLNVAGTNGGGLEHLESTLMMTGRFSTRRDEDYRKWLGLVSHEFFHAWNAKRLRPVELGPFDYENENHTPSLWIVEGLTSYYDDLLLMRAGLLTEAQYLERVQRNIGGLMNRPGRTVQSLSAASFDSWVKYYRRDENSRNSTISYYNKGSVVGFVLDAYVREVTGGQSSLDDVMRLVYERHSGARGYTPEDFRAAVREVVGESAPAGDGGDEGEGGHGAEGEASGVDALLDAWVDGTSELSFEEALDYYGLAFEGEADAEAERPDGRADGDGDDDDDTAGWLGVKQTGGFVTEVRRDGPAYGAGFSHDDELLAIDGFRVRDLAVHLARYRPGDTVSVTLARRGRLREISVTLGRAPGEDVYSLTDSDPLTAQQRSHRAAWLEDVTDVPAPAPATDQDVVEASAQNPAPAPAAAPSVVAPPPVPAAPGDDPGQEGQSGEQNPGAQEEG